ncbi:MAG TPA: hypothetical protein VHQ95_13860 [Pyrinomonadaceae bacterium]|nr:hypothetical protein [Pyrinomonadaceae bacterium]
MSKRICYIHIGPHKTGTSSIQWFLQENRAELLKYGYFVPETATRHGAHHPIARMLCGQELPDHQRSVAAKFTRGLIETPCEAVVISSEALEGLLRNRDHAKIFFTLIRELNLEPKLVVFPRNQSQRINSSYSSGIKTFRLSGSFETFVQGVTQGFAFRYSPLIELADAYNAELIARPFTGETIGRGVVPEFLLAIGINSSQFRNTRIRRNEAAGPFTVSLARGVLRSIGRTGKRLKWLQAIRCKAELANYLEENGLADAGYCGLTTALARQIEREFRPDNDAFAQRVWGRPWGEIFAADIRQEFIPNDFEMYRPDESTERRLERAIRGMTAIVEEILLDPALAVEAPWNDLLARAGRTPRAQIQES